MSFFPFFFSWQAPLIIITVLERVLCVHACVCVNDVSEWERKKSLFISVMKRVSMGLKREMKRGEEGDGGREGERDRGLFKSITLSNCQCCRRGEKRIEGPGEGGDGGVDLVLWFIPLLGELNLSQFASKQIYFEWEIKAWVRVVWPESASMGGGKLSITHASTLNVMLTIPQSLTHMHTHTLDHHARAVPFRAAWFISPLRMRVRQLSVTALV